MDRTKATFKLLDHTADLGIRVVGPDLETLFENAGKALVQVMVRGALPAKASPLTLAVTGEDLADLMVRWLGEILYLFEGDHLITAFLNVHTVTPSRIEATLQTTPFDPEIHEIQHEIKAVTYHQIEVAEKDGHWEARIIFDL
ncbi:MAG: archease [Pseudomonadota bacterium]